MPLTTTRYPSRIYFLQWCDEQLMHKCDIEGVQHKAQRVSLSTNVLLAQLFVDTVRSAIVAVRPTAPFVDSSPSNGVYSTDPYSKRYGLCLAWRRHLQE